MKEFRKMLLKASKILNVDNQLEFFLDNIHLCPELISRQNKIIFRLVNAKIIRGEVFIETKQAAKDIAQSLSLSNATQRVRKGVWLEFKKMPKRKLKL